jgi:molybdate transport system ATP-binding protein
VTERRGLRVRLRQAAPIPLDVEFECAPGGITALFGPSGSGKTTILRAIAGLTRAADATVECDGEVWTDTARQVDRPPRQRSVGFVFQDYALFPHLDVRQHVLLAMGHVPARERAARADALMARVHLEGLEARRPTELSGGQQQRVAIARALARDPAVLLFDEPFASVDRALRDVLHRELAQLRDALRIPTVLVTHDFDDVARLATNLVMLERGRIVASGAVTALTAANDLPGVSAWREPAVVLDGIIERHDVERELSWIRSGELLLQVPITSPHAGAAIRLQIPGREVILADRRPEGLSLHNSVEARVVAVDPAPAPGLAVVRLAVGTTPLLAVVTRDAVRNLGLAPGRGALALIKAVSVDAFA